MSEAPVSSAPARGPIPLGMKVILFGFVPLFLLSIGVLVGITIFSRIGTTPAATYDPLKPDFGYEDMRIPAFNLVDQDGKPTGLEVFSGRITVVGFIFTNCPMACPAMTAQMTTIQRATAGTPVRFAVVSLDPAHDTPAAFKQYAETWGMDAGRWTLLTQPNAGTPEAGKEVVSHRILEALKFHVAVDPRAQVPVKDGTMMDNIVHPSHLFLVGPGGQLLGRFDSKSAEEMRMLEDRARRAAIALSAGR